MTPETPYLTTNEMIKELNRRNYVVKLFNYDSWSADDSLYITPDIQVVQGCIGREYDERFDETFTEIMEEIIEDIAEHYDED